MRVQQQRDGAEDQQRHDHVGGAEVRAAHVHERERQEERGDEARGVVTNLPPQPVDDQDGEGAGSRGNRPGDQKERFVVSRPRREHVGDRVKPAGDRAPHEVAEIRERENPEKQPRIVVEVRQVPGEQRANRIDDRRFVGARLGVGQTEIQRAETDERPDSKQETEKPERGTP